MSWSRLTVTAHAELVALDLLDVVLDASHRALALTYPELARGPEATLARPEQHLAEALVYQLGCLQGLLARYRDLVSPPAQDEGDFPF